MNFRSFSGKCIVLTAKITSLTLLGKGYSSPIRKAFASLKSLLKDKPSGEMCQAATALTVSLA